MIASVRLRNGILFLVGHALQFQQNDSRALGPDQMKEVFKVGARRWMRGSVRAGLSAAA